MRRTAAVIPAAESYRIKGTSVRNSLPWTRFKPGDRVVAYIGMGAFAEQVATPAAARLPLPPEIGFDVAAAFTLTYRTSHPALANRAALQPDETMPLLSAAGIAAIVPPTTRST
ncbi:hypothetical protein IHE33_05405 [Mycetohabitans endofungorum]|uniref:hypothetical protein n=1 Tax=Mycetohabitans endofungorum TaxID=417203 RepID=UPI0030CCF314